MRALKVKPRYIKNFIGLLLFYIGFLVINLQIVGQAAVPAANKNMIGMQPRGYSRRLKIYHYGETPYGDHP